jgi:repressor LexA
MHNLPDKQREILDFIRTKHDNTGVFPSVREIAAHMNFKSTNTVDYHLRRLEQSGAIGRGGRLARSFILTDSPAKCERGIPIVGQVAAGQPVFAEQNFSGLVNFRGYFHCDEQTYALRVQGESMIDAGIFDGDVVIVHQQGDIQNGEIAVAMVGDEATVKRIYDEGERWRLQPENKTMQPIYVEKQQKHFNIAGKVVGVIRKI